MTLLLSLLEPESQPARVDVSVVPGDEVRIYALAPALAWSGLRTTVVRIGSALPPPDSTFVLAASVREEQDGTAALRLTGIGIDADLERIVDHGSARMVAPEALGDADWLSLTLPDLQRVRIGLRLRAPVAQGATATVGGSGTGRSNIAKGQTGLLWLVPTIWTIYTDQQQYVMNNIRALGKRLGLGPRSIQGLFIFAAFASASGVALWLQYDARAAAEASAETAQDDAARADDARQAALLAEMSCLAERRDLADELGKVDEVRRIRAERALAVSTAQVLARDEGGKRLGEDALLENDVAIIASTRDAISERMARVTADEDTARPCLDSAPALGDDLPRYALLWHPDAEVFCPPNYAGVAEGLTLVGRWGLSPRVADRYGAPVPRARSGSSAAELAEDPRASDRWSAQTLASALRDAQRTLLTAGDELRAPVWPSQAQLWSLALFDATNRLPRTAEGALDRPHAECIDALIVDIANQREALPPAEPTLPDLVDIADGNVSLRVGATPGCPFPPDALVHGAEAALVAVARLATVEEVPNSPRSP